MSVGINIIKEDLLSFQLGKGRRRRQIKLDQMGQEGSRPIWPRWPSQPMVEKPFGHKPRRLLGH